MPTATVRVSDSTHRILRQLAETRGETMQEILDVAVEQLRRASIWDEVDAAYSALRGSPKGWREEIEERKLWENTLEDGLDPSEPTAKKSRK
jgi:predicted transcriptional regulator